MISSQALVKTLFLGLLMLAVSANGCNAAVATDPMDAIPEDNTGGSAGMSFDAIPEDNTGGLGNRFLRGTIEDQGHRELCKFQSGWCTRNDQCCSRACRLFWCYG